MAVVLYITLTTKLNRWRTTEEPYRGLTGYLYGRGATHPVNIFMFLEHFSNVLFWFWEGYLECSKKSVNVQFV